MWKKITISSSKYENWKASTQNSSDPPPEPILYVTPSNGPAGANFSLLRLLKHLDRSRFAPRVICPTPAGGMLQEELNALDVPLIPLYLEEWGRMVGEQTSLRWRLAQPKRLSRRMASVGRMVSLIRREGVRIVHTNSVLVLEGALAAKIAGVPHVWHIRDRIGPEGSVQFRGGCERAIRRIRALSHTIITISRYVREPFEASCSPEQLRTIYNSVDLESFLRAEKNAGRIRKEFGGEPLIATVGHITPEKRHEDFLRAAAQIRQVFPTAKFLLVGQILDFHRDYAKSLQRLVRSLGLQDAAVFTGLRRDIPEILAAIDLLIHPRPNEGFGRVLIEAMAAGKPVVSVQSGGPAEIVENGLTGLLVPPGSPIHLARAAVQILTEPERARAMGEAGRRRVAERFTDAIYVQSIQRVYEEILGRIGD